MGKREPPDCLGIIPPDEGDLKKFLEDAGISHEELERLACVDRTTVNRWLGTNKPVIPIPWSVWALLNIVYGKKGNKLIKEIKDDISQDIEWSKTDKETSKFQKGKKYG